MDNRKYIGMDSADDYAVYVYHHARQRWRGRYLLALDEFIGWYQRAPRGPVSARPPSALGVCRLWHSSSRETVLAQVDIVNIRKYSLRLTVMLTVSTSRRLKRKLDNDETNVTCPMFCTSSIESISKCRGEILS
jgi:hypothetical protein